MNDYTGLTKEAERMLQEKRKKLKKELSPADQKKLRDTLGITLDNKPWGEENYHIKRIQLQGMKKSFLKKRAQEKEPAPTRYDLIKRDDE